MASVQGQDGRGIPFLVTNYHVVKDALRGHVELVVREGDGPSKSQKIRADIDPEFLTRFNDASLDLAAMPIGPAISQLDAAGTPVFIRTISEDMVPSDAQLEELSAVEEISFIGYPSGVYDRTNSLPVVRRGITATPVWNKFNDEEAFLVDAGVFPGSSGSPVLIVNQGSFNTAQGFTVGHRVLFLGVLSESMVRGSSEESKVFLGLGKVRRASSVTAFLASVMALIS